MRSSSIPAFFLFIFPAVFYGQKVFPQKAPETRALSSNNRSLTAEVDSTRVKDFLTHLIGVRHYETGPQKLEETRQYLLAAFANDGLITMRQKVEFQKHEGANIIGHLPGTKDKKKHVLITAHFDTVKDSPGADDNGSGVTCLLEAAAILSRQRFDYSIDFIGFDFEEEGSVGSNRYVSSLTQDSIEIIGVLNLDMVGVWSDAENSQAIPVDVSSWFPDATKKIHNDGDKADFLLDISNASSSSLADTFAVCIQRYLPQLKLVTLTSPPGKESEIPGFADSDHANFWRKKYKALFLGIGGPTRDPNYHSSEDNISAINFNFLCNVIRASIAFLSKEAVLQSHGID